MSHASEVAQTKEQLVTKMDADGDGKIDQNEFTQWVGEQASRVDQLEKSLERALADAKTASTEVEAAMTTKLTGKFTTSRCL